jgi:hypothetical protein
VGNTGKSVIMHKDLITFKKEVEAELVSAKQVFINSFAEKFLETSPRPDKTTTSTGYFIYQTNFKVGERNNTLGINFANNKVTRSGKFKRYNFSPNSGVTANIHFKVNRPYDKISITNFVYYQDFIETFGWSNTRPYMPFAKSKVYGINKLNEFLAKHKSFR